MATLPLLCILVYPLFLLCTSATASPDQEPRFRSEKYAKGFEGPYPLQRYRSADVSGPILNYWHRSVACEDGLYTILAPRGDSVRQSGPMIVDQQGHLVWFKKYQTTYNANVHKYKGERYLTFWAGDDSIRGHGAGSYYMLNSHYEEVYKIQGANGLSGDFHEFQITRDDTALFAVYEVLQIDLREVNGPEKGWIYDGLFQEVDVETNELLFQWRASEHFSLQEAERDREADGETEDNPWDFFHINSIDKDWRGNYLISARYTNSLAYIDGRTGDIIWKLGGKQNSFTDLSHGGATNISWQHHARFQVRTDTNATRMISVFDNTSRGEGAPEHTSRGLLIEINEETMTAAVVQEYWNPTPISSQSQGSMQVLENGDVVLGYGYSAAWTQFTADGEPLCEVHFGPRIEFHGGQIVSYRVFKQEWVGLPLTSPSVALSGTQAAVSWNGATEVVTWVLQGALPGVKVNGDDSAVAIRQRADDEEHDLEFEFITAIPKSGFETIVPLPADRLYSKLRIIALDKKGISLGATKALNWEPEEMKTQVAVYSGQEPHDDGKTGAAPDATSSWTIGIGLITVSILGFCVWLVCKIAYGRSLKGLFTRDKDDQAWQRVSTGEELEELDGFGDIESGDHASDSLLKQREE
ncbi:arylsulfotransferase [Penicillium brasilianum]|uniref:Arylsulfotransferase n=1 Tax=Penicillium brasilianum TaxID=104259 RepID=A0A1S9RU45_PENBI|nr:arylsulfotransferase [Penicillium brasilianum]